MIDNNNINSVQKDKDGVNICLDANIAALHNIVSKARKSVFSEWYNICNLAATHTFSTSVQPNNELDQGRITIVLRDKKANTKAINIQTNPFQANLINNVLKTKNLGIFFYFGLPYSDEVYQDEYKCSFITNLALSSHTIKEGETETAKEVYKAVIEDCRHAGLAYVKVLDVILASDELRPMFFKEWRKKALLESLRTLGSSVLYVGLFWLTTLFPGIGGTYISPGVAWSLSSGLCALFDIFGYNTELFGYDCKRKNAFLTCCASSILGSMIVVPTSNLISYAAELLFGHEVVISIFYSAFDLALSAGGYKLFDYFMLNRIYDSILNMLESADSIVNITKKEHDIEVIHI